MKLLTASIFAAATGMVTATPLSPADPSLSDDLLVWLKDAQTNFEPATGVWKDSSGKLNSSGQPYDATAAGLVTGVTVSGYTTANITWLAPELTLVDGGALAAGQSISGVRFKSTVNDLLGTPPLKDGAALGQNVTIAESSNGRTHPSGGWYLGSSPGSAAVM